MMATSDYKMVKKEIDPRFTPDLEKMWGQIHGMHAETLIKKTKCNVCKRAWEDDRSIPITYVACGNGFVVWWHDKDSVLWYKCKSRPNK